MAKSYSKLASSPADYGTFCNDSEGTQFFPQTALLSTLSPSIQEWNLDELGHESTCNHQARKDFSKILFRCVNQFFNEMIDEFGRRVPNKLAFLDRMIAIASINLGYALRDYGIEKVNLKVINTYLNAKYQDMANNANR